MMIHILTAREIKAMVLCKTTKVTKMIQSKLGSKIPDQLIVNLFKYRIIPPISIAISKTPFNFCVDRKSLLRSTSPSLAKIRETQREPEISPISQKLTEYTNNFLGKNNCTYILLLNVKTLKYC